MQLQLILPLLFEVTRFSKYFIFKRRINVIDKIKTVLPELQELG
jgi:hypothetical protein